MSEIEITDALLDEIEAKAKAVIYSDPYGPKKWSAVDDFSYLISPATALSLVARIRELEAKVEVSMKTAWAKSMGLGRRHALEDAAVLAEAHTKCARMNSILIRNLQDESLCPPCELASAIRALKDKEAAR